MMLTGPAIRRAIVEGVIRVDPYEPGNVGPNSLDLTLSDTMLVYASHVGPDGSLFMHEGSPLDSKTPNETRVHVFTGDSVLLYPGVLYLASTRERIHSNLYGATVHGRSSLGRLGVVVHQTAGFVDVGFDGRITLEITVVHPVLLYAGMRIAQLAFHRMEGEIELYTGKYQHAESVEASKIYLDKRTREG